MFTIVYAATTAIWQVVTGDAVVYPGALDWICEKRDGAASGCLFNECILWFIYFMLVQTGCFSFVLMCHYLKSKYCCKRAVPIITYQQESIHNLGSIMSSKRD